MRKKGTENRRKIQETSRKIETIGYVNETLKENSQRGITLVALVITVIIIIILAIVTISFAFGNNGLIKRAENAKDMYTNDIKHTDSLTENVESYINDILIGAGGSESDISYADDVLPIPPTVSDGMIPVKYDENLGWVRTEEKDPEWYNYSNVDKTGGAKAKHWANVVLSEATWIETDVGTEKEGTNKVQVLDEGKPYSMLVWIPRYAYQITSQYHQGGPGGGNINIVFVDTNNQNKEKTKTYNIEYPEYATGTGMIDYVVHPAFRYGDSEESMTELAGIWVGKFETSNQNCTTSISTGQYGGTGRAIMIKGNVTSWRSITISNMFKVCTSMNNTTSNIYGLGGDSEVDPHMMKNTEWGAVVYLAQNAKYGRGSEIKINDNSSYLTGGGDYKSNLNQSTNENVTGVYDMSGGAWEYVAAYAENGNTNGAELVGAESRYKNVYSSLDYEIATTPSNCFGDALYETSGSGTGNNGWYSDPSFFPSSVPPFFGRGGTYYNAPDVGAFFISTYNGDGGTNIGFRLVVPVL